MKIKVFSAHYQQIKKMLIFGAVALQKFMRLCVIENFMLPLQKNNIRNELKTNTTKF
jgi:hypothetical protein